MGFEDRSSIPRDELVQQLLERLPLRSRRSRRRDSSDERLDRHRCDRLTDQLQRRILPISQPIAEALARRRARRDPGSPLVFHRDGIPIRRWRTAWRTACASRIPNSLAESRIKATLHGA